MMKLIECLEKFNRKERYFLVKQTLGNFDISPEFRILLSALTGIPVPTDAYCAMDYHIDWIYAAIEYSLGHKHGIRTPKGSPLNIAGTQEDIDMIVAFEFPKKSGEYHLIMIEAKADTSWGNTQMASKSERLKHIFGPNGKHYPNIVPHFIYASPNPPQNLNCSQFPSFMDLQNGTAKILELNYPKTFLKVERCNDEGMSASNGGKWKIIKD
jgi:hypothetical protein